MKKVIRKALRIIGWVELGCLITVAIAWGQVLVGLDASPYSDRVGSAWCIFEEGRDFETGTGLGVRVNSTLGSRMLFVTRGWPYHGFDGPRSSRENVLQWIPRGCLQYVEEMIEDPEDYNNEYLQLSGFPFTAMWCVAPSRSTWSSFTPVPPPRAIGGFLVPDWIQSSEDRNVHRTLAYRPLWIGLVFNSMFWGGALAFVTWFVRSSVLVRRMKLGVCPKCRYRLNQGSCPECGWGRAGVSA